MSKRTGISVWISSRVEPWLFAGVLVILIGYVLYPSLRVFIEGLTPANIRGVFSSWSSANVRALYNSVWISIASVIGSGLVGTTLAWLFFRFDFPLKKILAPLAIVPLALPPLVGVLAFLFLYGESGILPRALQTLFNLESVPFSFSGFWAVLLVHVYSMYVFFYLFSAAALRNIDRSLMEASADLAAGSGRTFLVVVFPVLRPSLMSASLLVFMISMASFTAPLLFAGSENFLTLQIFNYKTNGNLEYSATVSAILTLICLVFLFLIEFRVQAKRTATASKGAAPVAIPVRSGTTRALAFIGSLSVIVVLLLPIITIVLISFVQEGSWTYQVFPQRFTWDNYLNLVSQKDVFQPVLNSINMAAVATSGNIFFGVLAAIVVSRGQIRGRLLIRTLAVLPFAIPGTVIAVNLIVTFSESSALSLGQVLVGSFWMLPLAYFIRHIPLVYRATLSALESYDDRFSEASTDLGASRFQTFRRVALPMIGPGIAAGGLLTFVTALGEFVSSIMLYIFDNRPISVEILSQLRLYDFGAAAAYSVFLMLLIGLATVIVQRIGAASDPVLRTV